MLALSAMPFLSKKLRRCAGFAPDPISQPLTTVNPYTHQLKRVKG
jgi:hypothetical protein